MVCITVCIDLKTLNDNKFVCKITRIEQLYIYHKAGGLVVTGIDIPMRS